LLRRLNDDGWCRMPLALNNASATDFRRVDGRLPAVDALDVDFRSRGHQRPIESSTGSSAVMAASRSRQRFYQSWRMKPPTPTHSPKQSKAKQSRIWAQAQCLDAHQSSCAGVRHNIPPPLQVDLLTLKVVSESRVTWPTSVPILVFLSLSVLDLGPMYATDRQTSDIRRASSLNAHYHRGGGIITT